MKYTLYHYIHCPFCIRVRMALGYLQIPYESMPVSYEDEKTPLALTGVKMLPILVDENGIAINESLDIMAKIDRSNVLKISESIQHPHFIELEKLLNTVGGPIHSLAMPQWIYTKEFSPAAREYFQKKKEIKRGPFKDLVHNKIKFLNELDKYWPEILNNLNPFYKSQEFGLFDILIASHLWGLYIVPEFQFPPEIHLYLQRIKLICNFDYHEDLWR
ncbi:MAG: glutaredoxin 2 [Bacteriovoracaceae bacterium]